MQQERWFTGIVPLIRVVQPWPFTAEGSLITTQRPLKPVKWCRRWRRIKVKRALVYYQLHIVRWQDEAISLNRRERNGVQLTLHILDSMLVNAMFRTEFHQAPYFHMTGEELDACTLCSVSSEVFKDMDHFETVKLKVYDRLLLQLWLKSIQTIIKSRRGESWLNRVQ